MKKIQFLLISILLIMFSSIAVSSPIYYKVEGFVSGIYGNGPSVEALNISRSDIVSYSFIIDRNLPGYTLSSNGSISYAEDSNIENDRR